LRGPLLTLAVRIEVQGNGFSVHATDDVVRINVLPFKAERDSEIHEHKISRIIDATPNLPLDGKDLDHLVNCVTREFRYVKRGDAILDGRLVPPPAEPRDGGDLGMWLVDQAALFIAPKASYFLTSDLDHIGVAVGDVSTSALDQLLVRPGSQSPVDLSDMKVDSTRLFFPFPSNRSQ
jgi:hypothetical protein